MIFQQAPTPVFRIRNSERSSQAVAFALPPPWFSSSSLVPWRLVPLESFSFHQDKIDIRFRWKAHPRGHNLRG